MDNTKPHILDLAYPQLQELVVSLGEKAYRADQLLGWIYKKLASSFEEMSDISRPFRQKLIEETVLSTFTLLEEKISADKQTVKMLFRLEDNKTIESTLMFYKRTKAARERRTVCVSSQVGCPIGCYFCATGQQGFERNLRPGEIIEQILFFMRYLRDKNMTEELDISRRWITNVVFMGMGEPLANYENLRKAIITLNSPQGLGLGLRQITLSTSGLAPQIRQLANEPLHLELAISLHAAKDELRNRLVPINQKYPLAELMSACKEYFARTGRRPTFEYALFAGINDSAKNADDLIRLLGDFNCSVNLIVGNPTSSREYRPSPLDQAVIFQKILIAGGLRTMIRVSKGADIEAGCGQLKSRWISGSAK